MSALSHIARSRAHRVARLAGGTALVCAPLALVALPARDLARERARVDALRAEVDARRGATPPADEIERLESGVSELEARLAARTESGLAERVLADVFARDAGIELAALDAGHDGDDRLEVRGSATLPAWANWLGALAAHGLAPRVQAFRLVRKTAADTSFEGAFTLVFARADEVER